MGLGTAGILYCWALQEYSAVTVGHRTDAVLLCMDTLRSGPAGILGGWALQGYSAVAHCRDILWLGTAGMFWGWALRGYSVLGTARIRCHWALQSGSARRARTTLTFKVSQAHCEGVELHWAPQSIDMTYIGLLELLSKLLVSPLITPIVVPYIIPYIFPL